jgi:hypothetical protein
MARPFVLAGFCNVAPLLRPTRAGRPAHLLAALAALAPLAVGCVEQSNEPTQASPEDVKLAQDHILTTAPTPRFPSGAVLDNGDKGQLVYLGSDVDVTTVVPGQGFTLTHYFKVEKPIAEGWRLFVHLDGTPTRRAHLNADHVPVSGHYPLPMWKPGQIIRDIHKVMVPPSWPADKVSIYLGLWKGPLRFPVKSGRQDGQNRALVAELPVKVDPAAAPPMRRLVARRLPAGTVINIDGKLDEQAWKDAASSTPFVNTMDGSPAPQLSTAKVLWDDQNLYVAFDFADTDIWGTFEKHDDKLWTQEAAEMFIDPDGDGKTYIELQVSPRNVTYDAWLPAYRQNDVPWDAQLKTAVQVNGTLDNRSDKDTGWTVEMMIPMASVKGRLQTVAGVPPQVGTQWRVNFFRMDMPAGKPQQGTSWSPPMVGDFHALDKFGILVFGDEQGAVPATGPHTLNPTLQRSMVATPPAGEAGKAGEATGTPALSSGNVPVEPAKPAPPAAKPEAGKGAPAGKKGGAGKPAHP